MREAPDFRRAPSVHARLGGGPRGDARFLLRRALARVRLDADPIFACALTLLVTSMLFGGASQDNALPLGAVELASLPLLFAAIYRIVTRGHPPGARLPLALLIGVVMIPLLQLAPLPPQIWSRLPGRDVVARVMDLTGLGRPTLPYSLYPEATWRSLLALAPPAAMFLGALQLSGRQKQMMTACWIALGLVSLLIGALQMSGGADSPLYFYAITNKGSAVGLFANRNHHAAFIVSLLPFAAMFTIELKGRVAAPQALAALFFPIAIVAIAVIDSRAGVALLGASLIASLAIVARTSTVGRRTLLMITLAAIAIGVAGAGLFALGPILQRFGGAASSNELRFEGWPIVIKLAGEYLPFGTGVGAFEPIYRSAEPLTQVTNVYFNHAHNDYLELWLETGVAGLILLLAFLGWLVRTIWRAWTAPAAEGRGAVALSSSVVILLLLAHSALDYPLRVEAIAVLFAFACGVMASQTERGGKAGGTIRQPA